MLEERMKNRMRFEKSLDAFVAEIIAEFEGVPKMEEHTEESFETAERENASRKCTEPAEEKSQRSSETKLELPLSRKPETRTVMSMEGNNDGCTE